MEWAQVLAIVIPIVFTIVVGIFYNNRQLGLTNKRIDDLRADMGSLRADMGSLRAEMDRRFAELKAEMDGRFDNQKADMDRRFTEAHDELREIKADIREIRQVLLRLIPTPFKEEPKEG